LNKDNVLPRKTQNDLYFVTDGVVFISPLLWIIN